MPYGRPESPGLVLSCRGTAPLSRQLSKRSRGCIPARVRGADLKLEIHSPAEGAGHSSLLIPESSTPRAVDSPGRRSSGRRSSRMPGGKPQVLLVGQPGASETPIRDLGLGDLRTVDVEGASWADSVVI